MPGPQGVRVVAGGTNYTSRPMQHASAMALSVGCGERVFIGPWDAPAAGASRVVTLALRSVEGPEVCGLEARWVDREANPIAMVTTGCFSGTTDTERVATLTGDATPRPGGVLLELSLPQAAGCRGVLVRAGQNPSL